MAVLVPQVVALVLQIRRQVRVRGAILLATRLGAVLLATMRIPNTLVAAALVSLILLSGCSSESPVPTDGGVGALHGRVGPGAPPDGDVPESLEVLFESGSEQKRTTARDGEYEIELPVGTWDVRTGDGKACSLDVLVQGATRQRLDLIYPADCRRG